MCLPMRQGLKHWGRVRRLQQLWAGLILVTMVTCLWLMTLQMDVPQQPGFGPYQRFITLAYPDGSRTGNLMFAYAALVGLATYHNMTPILPATFPLRNMFQLPLEVGDSSRMTNKYDYEEYGRRSSAYDINTRHLQFPKEYVLHGYFQSWMYFENAYEKVHKHFDFLAEMKQQSEEFYRKDIPEEYRTESTVRVGIHVRMGDIHKEQRLRDFGYTTAPPEYYTKAMAYFKERHKHVVFIVCSDDMGWTRANIRGDDVVYCPGKDAGLDLCVLKSCEHMIMSVGSFGWWAAWLANGTTLYYGNWPRSTSMLEYNVDKRQYFPSQWIPMQ